MECLSVTARTCFKKQENGLSEKPHEIERKKMQVIYLRTVIKLFRLLKIFFSLYFQCGTWCYRQASVTWLDVATYSSQRRKLAQIWRQCSPQSSSEYCFTPSLLFSLSWKEDVVFVTSVLCIGSILKTVQAECAPSYPSAEEQCVSWACLLMAALQHQPCWESCVCWPGQPRAPWARKTRGKLQGK